VQVEEAFEPIDDGAQLTEFNVVAGGVWSVTVNVGLWLPRVAVTIADELLLGDKFPVVAEKVALLLPEVTTTLDGTVSAALPLPRETVTLEVAV
jgi:hypothetical protein